MPLSFQDISLKDGHDGVDLLIVGTGLHGLCMAKTYLQVQPEANILLVDQNQSIGGTWAKERLYPGLKTNNIFGSYEYADFPMVAERYGAEATGHIPGSVVYAYLCDFAVHYGIDSFILLGTKVNSARLEDCGTWSIKLQSMKDLSTSTIVAKKLVIATGITSEPYTPKFIGEELFGCPILHAKLLSNHMRELGSGRTVIVVGGNKSSWDACYGLAQSGSQVHMVIRPSGGGPSYLWPRKFAWGLNALSMGILSATRIYTVFDPTLYGNHGPLAWLRSFIHKTKIGQKVGQLFWNRLDLRLRKLNGYHSHPELQKLEPWTTTFWMGNYLSIHNYDTSWFDLVREGRIRIHIAEIESLDKGRVYLSSGENLDADALVCCTGWRTDCSIQLEPPSVQSCMSLPEESFHTQRDFDRAEAELSSELPYLATLPRRTTNAPSVQQHSPQRTSISYQLHRSLVPSGRSFLANRPIAFLGLHSSVHATIVAEAQALWITAFFQDKLKHLQANNIDFEAVRYDAALHSVYGRLRRPKETGGAGSKYPDLVFDSIPYVDTLLRDLDLSPTRKKNLWRELFQIYRPQDYMGIVEEWKAISKGSGIYV